MDDMPQILDNAAIPAGEFVKARFLAWTQLGYILQYKLFGMSAVGFHAVNWLLHTATACVLFAFGRDFVKDRWPQGVALFGALLFAVHPLGSEIPNYARAQDLAWVTLFSLLAAWAILLFMRQGGWELVPGEEQGQIPIFQRTNRWWKLLLCGLAVAGATFSKGPGFLHAMTAVTVVALAFMPRDDWSRPRKWWWIPAGIALSCGLFWALGVPGFMEGVVKKWQEPRFAGHAYTLGRVFWEFAWRAVIPVSQSSDHGITETLIPAGGSIWNIPDRVAMLATAGMFALGGFATWLTIKRRTRLVGICLLLFVTTILFRVAYLIPEFMPEYRIYPGLPWFCLGAAIVATASWRWLSSLSPAVPAALVICLFAGMSAKRSFVWHDLDRLTMDVLNRYPARARVIWELHDRDAIAGNWQAIIERQQKLWPEVERQFIAGNGRLTTSWKGKVVPYREIPSGDFVLAMVAIHGRFARAVAHVEGPAAGLRIMALLEAHMRQMQMTPENKPLEWGYFNRDKALILELAGRFQEALDLPRPKTVRDAWQRDFDRIARKLQETQP